jgi:hypothetical protein
MEKWNSSVMFPQDNFILRCIEESFGPSKSSGNPMITLGFEIVAPETVNVAGVDYSVTGLKITPGYYTTATLDDAEKTAQNEARVFKSSNPERPSLYELFEIDSTGVDKNNPKLEFKGKLVHALLRSEVKEKTKSPTAEQLKKGQKVGDVIKNPKTGKPEISFYPKIEKLYGIADSTVSGAL